MRESNLNDHETAILMSEWIIRDKAGKVSHFSWPTDGAGYQQHVRFVEHRNVNWAGGDEEAWRQFVEDYASALADEP